MRTQFILLLLLVLCLGCNDAAERRRAEQAQRDATINELRQLGQAMHESHASDSASGPVAGVAQESSVDSTELPSGRPVAPERPVADEGSGNVVQPTD